MEAVYALLRDFNAFNPESGLTKSSLRKILINIQKQVAQESKGLTIKSNPFDAPMSSSSSMKPVVVTQVKSASPMARN